MPTEYKNAPAQSTGWKSKAQRERCQTLVAEGKMKKEDFDRIERETADIEGLPERLHPKKEKPSEPKAE